jgi:hypothetical protein
VKNRKKKSQPWKDNLPTTWKKAWRGLTAEATLRLIPKGASIGVSIVATPVGGEFVGAATKRVLRYMLRRFAHIYEDGEFKLTEFLRREIPDFRYASVGDFWVRIAKQDLTRFDFEKEKPLIEVFGFLSPYGPLMPAHPMSRPGYTVEG